MMEPVVEVETGAERVAETNHRHQAAEVGAKVAEEALRALGEAAKADVTNRPRPRSRRYEGRIRTGHFEG